MFLAFITNNVTYLFKDTNEELFFNSEEPKKPYNAPIIGALLNDENIIELIDSIPISQFYVEDFQNHGKKISKVAALELYENIIKFLEERKANKNI